MNPRFDLDQNDVPGSVVRAALAWSGCGYHHAADVFGVGVDCAMLPVRVFCDLGLVPPFDPRPYPYDWHLHRSGERYLGWVEKFAGPVDEPQPGDLALFQFGRAASHGGIVISPGVMLHADMHAGCVVRCEIARFTERLRGYWRVRT